MFATTTRNKLILEGVDAAFYIVSSTVARWNDLEVYVFVLHA